MRARTIIGLCMVAAPFVAIVVYSSIVSYEARCAFAIALSAVTLIVWGIYLTMPSDVATQLREGGPPIDREPAPTPAPPPKRVPPPSQCPPLNRIYAEPGHRFKGYQPCGCGRGSSCNPARPSGPPPDGMKQ